MVPAPRSVSVLPSTAVATPRRRWCYSWKSSGRAAVTLSTGGVVIPLLNPRRKPTHPPSRRSVRGENNAANQQAVGRYRRYVDSPRALGRADIIRHERPISRVRCRQGFGFSGIERVCTVG